MTDVILDDTWSYRLSVDVFIAGRPDPIICCLGRYEKYDDVTAKRDMLNLVRTIDTAFRTGRTLILSNVQFRVEEVQCTSIKVKLINEANRGKIYSAIETSLLRELMAYVADKNQTDDDVPDEDDSI